MREVEQLDRFYDSDGRLSVFAGMCGSQELFEQYWEKDYELLADGYIGFEMGVDFGINTYDEDFAVMVLQSAPTSSIDALFAGAEMFDLNQLKKLFPDGLDRPYNAVIVLGGMAYDGAVKEVRHETFGHYRFLGVFDASC